MLSTTLKDDLLAEFREERIMINDQMELLDPLAISLRQPAAQRLLSSGTLVITEFVCYVLSIGGIAFALLMHRIFPFNLLSKLLYSADVRTRVGGPNLTMLIGATYILVAICIVFVFVIGRMAREIRLKNDILHMAAKNVKTIVGQHLERRAALRTIEQRHLLGLSGVMHVPNPTKITPVNEVLNAGF